ncbi:MAG: DUF2207 domain-containing protein [Actinomycetota bacterium]
MRLLARLLFASACVVAVPAFGASGSSAAGSESITSYDVDITIQPNGDLSVVETIAYDFGNEPRHGIFRDIPTRVRYDDRYDRVYPLRVDDVSGSAGTPVGYTIEAAGGGMTRIKIGDPDQTVTGPHTYRIAYTVQGAMNAFDSHDELYWNAIGDEWSTMIERATVRVTAPGAVTAVACFAGSSGSKLPCDDAQARGAIARFAQSQVFPYEALTIVVGIEKGAVAVSPPVLQERWSVGRAFRVTGSTLTASGLILLLGCGAFGYAVWNRGRDRRYQGSLVDQVMGNPQGATQRTPIGEGDAVAPVEFGPPEGIRPGQVGTLVDERANTLDVSASIVDLAVRGYLVIQEIPKEGLFGKPDWRLVRLEAPTGVLMPYERLLLDGLFRDGGDVTLSSLRTTFSERLGAVEESLYSNAKQQGWFTARPDKVRARWRLGGLGLTVAAIAIAAALATFTGLGLIGLALVLVGFVFLFGAGRMPARTAKGTAMLRRVRGFRQVIETADRYFAQWAEKENVFPKMLPYAIVFGLTEKWAAAFATLAQDPTTTSAMAWYVPQAAASLGSFAESIDGFTVATSGTISSTPAGSGSSGFGGGGFSGGGGGGGGGGSW